MSNGLEAVIDRMGDQRQRLRRALGPRRAELVQFSLLAVLFLPWYMALIRPGLTPVFGFFAAPVFLIGWIVLSLRGPRDKAVAALAGLCALLGFSAFAVNALTKPAAPSAEVEEWAPPSDAIATEVTPVR